MRSILTLAVAGFVAVAAIAPASAATRHKQPGPQRSRGRATR